MIRCLFFLFLLANAAWSACTKISTPTDYALVANGTRANLKANFTEIETRVNPCMDSVDEVRGRLSGYSSSLLVTSLEHLRLKLDGDASGTGKLLVESSNGDSLFRVSEDSTARFFGALTLKRTTLTDSLIGVSQRLSGNLAAVNGAFSGPVTHSSTFTQTGLQSNAEAIAFVGNGTGGTGRIYKDATNGMVFRGVSGSSYDAMLVNVAGNALIQNPTGTAGLQFAGSGTYAFTGPVTMSSTLGVNGTITSNAAGTGTNSGFLASSTIASYGWYETDAGADAKLWDVVANVGVMDFRTRTDAGGAGTTWLSVSRSGATATGVTIAPAVTMSSTLGVTGVATFTAAPVFNSVTASQFLLVDGSKALTSVAGTGSGSVVRATSPTLVTPVLGAATATSIAASGNVSADSLISSKFHNFGTFTGTMTGFTTSPTTTARWERVGQNVTICLDSASATGSGTAFTITGMPASLYPARNSYAGIAPFRNPTGAGEAMATIVVQADGVIRLDPVEESGLHLKWGAFSWNAASPKGIGGTEGSLVIASVCFTYNRR